MILQFLLVLFFSYSCAFSWFGSNPFYRNTLVSLLNKVPNSIHWLMETLMEFVVVLYFFFFILCFSVWGSFECSLLHFRAKIYDLRGILVPKCSKCNRAILAPKCSKNCDMQMNKFSSEMQQMEKCPRLEEQQPKKTQRKRHPWLILMFPIFFCCGGDVTAAS